MNLTQRRLITTLSAAAALVLTLAPLQAEAQGRHGGGPSAYRGGHGGYGHYHGGYGGYGGYGRRGGYGYWGPGLLFGGVALGIGLGSYYGPPWAPAYVVVEPPPPVYYPVQPLPLPLPVVPAAPVIPEPVIYPRSGQSPAQTEADRLDCNRWATTQPAAMADASVFSRATAACMDGRGYTLR